MNMRFMASVALVASLAATTPGFAQPMTLVGAVAPSVPVSFDVVLPLRDRAGLDGLMKAQQDPASPLFHKWLTPATFEARFGPDAATVEAARRQLLAAGVSVTVLGRVLQASGDAAAAVRALHAPLAMGRTASGGLHPFAASAAAPGGAIAASGGIVVGLERDRTLYHPLSRLLPFPSIPVGAPRNRQGTTGFYWYDDLRQAYGYPSYQTTVTVNGTRQRLDGTGATVGIVMSSDVLDADVDAMFNHENFRQNSGQARNPHVYKRVGIDGGGSFTDSGSFAEASLDVQQVLGGAPGAKLILYATLDLSEQAISDAYLRIITDNQADVVSLSFGACELAYTAAYNNGADQTATLRFEHELFVQGNAQGITFLASSGDSAGRECPAASYVSGTSGPSVPSVSLPAADPNVTAVGGTNLVTVAKAGSLDSSYVKENAFGDPELPRDPYGLGATVSDLWWGAGGGISTLFDKPDYQTTGSINTGSNTRRALPDIGMQVGGCPGSLAVHPCDGGNLPRNGNGNTERSAAAIVLNGVIGGVIGTSVSSPEFASAAALLVERAGRMGNLNPYIYALGHAQTVSAGAPIFHRSIPGYNGVVTNRFPVNTNGAYYNFTVGVGTPIVRRFIGLPLAAAAGIPQTSSNP